MTCISKPELIQKVVDLQTDLTAMNSRQTFGGDSLTGSLTVTANLYDLTVTLPSYLSEANYLMTFTSTAGLPALTSLFPFYSINAPDVMNNYVGPWWNGPLIGLVIQPLGTNGGVTQWWIRLVNADSSSGSWTAYFKYIITGTDSGTVTFVSV
jgi:hypothetical protein